MSNKVTTDEIIDIGLALEQVKKSTTKQINANKEYLIKLNRTKKTIKKMLNKAK